MTSRQEKIKVLQLIREGSLPAKFVDADRFRILYGKPNQDFYVNGQGEKVTIEEQQIYKEFFPESMVMINVSKQFPDLL